MDLGRTGYPLALGMNVEAGRKRYLVGSATHCRKTSIEDGSGGVRSRAKEEYKVQLHSGQ